MIKRNKRNIINNYLTTSYIILLLIYILVSDVLILHRNYSLSELSIGLIYFGLGGLAIYIINKIVNKIKFDIYDVLILSMIILGVVATYYAVDYKASLFGFVGRYEGLLQLVVYYILFLNCKNIDNRWCKSILINTIIVIGLLHAVYGILQFLDIEKIFGYEVIRNRFYSTGFELNPNFFGTVMIVCFSLSITLYFVKKGLVKSMLNLVFSVILFLGLLCSGAMSAAMALLFVIIFLVILFFVLKLDKKEVLVKVIVVILGCISSYFIFNQYDKGYYLSQVKKTALEVEETIYGNAMNTYGSGRIHIWVETLKVVPDNIWNGVGIDNFYYAFGERNLIDVKSKLVVDKAHNEYLQKLITEGIFSFLVYLCLILMIFVGSLRKVIYDKDKYDYLFVVLFLSFISYCVQAFFNISVISVAPKFYIIMGLLCSYIKGGINGTVRN